MAWNVYIMGNAETPEEEAAALAFAQSVDLSLFPNVAVASFSGSLTGGTTFFESQIAASKKAPTTLSNGDVLEQPETPNTE